LQNLGTEQNAENWFMWSAAYMNNNNMWEFAQEPTASTAVDVKELPNSFIFVADMPGVKHTEVKVRCPS
jgi:HSP20 family molecular chaperone IbpA